MQKRVALCPHCKHNLLICGIVECLEGASTETEISFHNGTAEYSETTANQLTDQWITCRCCNKAIEDVTAYDIINFANEAIDSIDRLVTKIEEV